VSAPQFTPLREIKGDHDYSLDGPFSGKRVIGQARYFKTGDIVLAVGELNRPNHWDDEAFDAACAFLRDAWKAALAKARGEVA
jgi:hypothetical protein